MNIYLIRHGEAEHNVDHSRMAHTHDSQHSLTALGEIQVGQTAAFLGSHLQGRTFMFSSPYRRTMQTAEAIRGMLAEDTPLLQNLLIREWELGNLYDAENRTEVTKKEYKAAGQLFFRFHNGESLADVYLRAAMFFQTKVLPLSSRNQFDDLLIVTHAAFIHMMLSFLMDWPVEEIQGFRPTENASVIQVQEKNGSYTYTKIYVPDAAQLS